METIATFFRDGGIFMYLILAASMVGAAIIGDRVIHLMFKYNVDARELWKKVSACVQEGNIEKARSFCRNLNSPLARVLDKGLSHHGGSERNLQNAIDEVSLEVIPSIDKRIPHLAMTANIATLLGLLGTIQGLTQAFSAVGSADPSQKAALLASGISIALYTTAFGLIVAIPMLAMYSLLQARAHKIVDEIDEFSVKLMNLLVSHKQDRRGDGAQAK